MALTIHTEEPELYEIEGVQADVADATPEQEPEATENADQQLDAEPERISDAEDFRIQIWNAEMRCRGREAIVEDLKEQLKAAKAEYEQAVTALRRLANDGGRPLPLFDKQPEEAQSVVTAPDDSENNSWRDLSFSDFIKEANIDGLGAKKREVLADAVSTFGDFEDLRSKASQQCVHLSKLLPTGFGEKITDQIEEAYLECVISDTKSDPGYEDEPYQPSDDGLEYEDADDIDDL